MKDKSLLQKTVWVVLILAGSIAFFWLVVVRFWFKKRGGAPCPYALAWMTDNPIRRRYMGKMLGRVGIRPGERVLELGPGPGTFTIEAARRTEPAGTLVAIDIQPEMIAAVAKRVCDAGQTNVEMHVASAYELPLEDESVDRCFLVTVLPEIPDQQRALADLHRVLRPGGVLSVTEEFLDPDYPLMRTTVRWAEEAGFELAERHGNWWIYTVNFRKPA